LDDRAAGNEIDIRSRKFYKLLLLSGAMGAAGALLTLAFIIVLRSGIQLIWYLVPQQLGVPDGTALPLFVIGTCVAGGALVGLITRYSHARPTLLAEELGEFADCGRLDIRNGAASLLRGLVGLMFGGSIGPEGPLTGGSGALGTWLAERLKYSRPVVAVSSLSGMSGMFGSFLGSPFGFAMFTIEAGLEEGKLSWKLLLPSVVAASVGYGVFFALTGYVFGGDYDLPPYGEWYLSILSMPCPSAFWAACLGCCSSGCSSPCTGGPIDGVRGRSQPPCSPASSLASRARSFPSCCSPATTRSRRSSTAPRPWARPCSLPLPF